MKYLVTITLLLANIAFAETSVERAKLYLSDVQNRGFVAAMGHFDPEQLKEFRTMMEFYKEIPLEEQDQFIQTFFGPGQTADSVDKINDIEFFTGIFNFIMQTAKTAGDLNFDKLEILGEVKEGETLSHLVTRNRISVGLVDIEAMEVVSLKKSSDSWRIMMSGNIKGLPEQLKAALSQ